MKYTDFLSLMDRKLTIVYDSPKRGAESRTIWPHSLEYGKNPWHGDGNTWSLKAMCADRCCMRSFPVDRISRVAWKFGRNVEVE